MCTRNALAFAVVALLLASPAWGQEKSSSSKTRYGFGAPATKEDLARFVSPLPDGRGLPEGSGTVAAGKEIYTQQCAACHGANLEGGQGDRLVGGRGSLPGNNPAKPPVKTVESYWPYATTLFDYIKRAMPLTSPGSLTNDQVYSVAAYILSQAKIVPADATLDARSLAAVRMPNRDGFLRPDPRPERFAPPAKAKQEVKQEVKGSAQ